MGTEEQFDLLPADNSDNHQCLIICTPTMQRTPTKKKKILLYSMSFFKVKDILADIICNKGKKSFEFPGRHRTLSNHLNHLVLYKVGKKSNRTTNKNYKTFTFYKIPHFIYIYDHSRGWTEGSLFDSYYTNV